MTRPCRCSPKVCCHSAQVPLLAEWLYVAPGIPESLSKEQVHHCARLPARPRLLHGPFDTLAPQSCTIHSRPAPSCQPFYTKRSLFLDIDPAMPFS